MWCVRGVHGKQWTRRRRGRLELQRGALTGVSYQDAEYASDIITEGDEQKAERKPWWKRLFSGFRKSKSAGEECEEASVSRMDQMVWDNYEQQLYENGSQETVYFADLDSMTEQYDGLYCLNAQGKEQNPCTAGGIRRKNQCARPEFQKWNERQWT